jgi:hypothetical protein
MAINYGPTTKSYISGLKLELDGLDKNPKTYDAAKSLIEAEISAAEKNLKVEEKEAADREAAEND